MLTYLVRRFLVMIPTLFATSAIIFGVMLLSPSDYFSNYAAELQAQGEKADTSRIDFMRKEYGMDKPPVERYFRWVGGFFTGDFGYSFEYQMPVRNVVGDRLYLTMLLSFTSIPGPTIASQRSACSALPSPTSFWRCCFSISPMCGSACRSAG